MNFCTRCGSYYLQPGTCNCFAHGHPVAVPVQPIIPVWPRPYQEPLPWRPSGTGDPFPPLYETTCGDTTWVRANQMPGPEAIYNGGGNA